MRRFYCGCLVLLVALFATLPAFADKAGSLQMTSDRAALQRQINRLDVAEARLKSDTASGRMAAESKDAEKVYTELQNIKSADKQIAVDKAALTADQKR